MIVYDQFGFAVRRLDGGTHTVPPGETISGHTLWNGRRSGGGLIDVGVYHYRVIAYDEAGNVAQSGESRPLQVRLSLL